MSGGGLLYRDADPLDDFGPLGSFRAYEFGKLLRSAAPDHYARHNTVETSNGR